MKEKREIILFFTRLLMLGNLTGNSVWRDFWSGYRKKSGYVAEDMCRRSDALLPAGARIF